MQPVTLAACHLTIGIENPDRSLQIAELLNECQERIDPSAMGLICGDFNADEAQSDIS